MKAILRPKHMLRVKFGDHDLSEFVDTITVNTPSGPCLYEWSVEAFWSGPVNWVQEIAGERAGPSPTQELVITFVREDGATRTVRGLAILTDVYLRQNRGEAKQSEVHWAGSGPLNYEETEAQEQKEDRIMVYEYVIVELGKVNIEGTSDPERILVDGDKVVAVSVEAVKTQAILKHAIALRKADISRIEVRVRPFRACD